MSSYLGKPAARAALLHMTDGVTTLANIQADPRPETVFHSDLPYLSVTYSETLSVDHDYKGGKVFLLSQALKDYRAANDYTYFLVLEDAGGNRWIHDPCMNVIGLYDNVGTFNEWMLATNGIDYQVGFFVSDAQAENMTQNTLYPTFAATFHTWDNADDRFIVTRTPSKNRTNNWDYSGGSYPTWIGQYLAELISFVWTPKFPVSVGMDVVSAQIHFINVKSTSSSFSIDPRTPSDSVSITPTSFDVGGLDLAALQPIVNRGIQTGASGITPVLGDGSLLVSKGVGNRQEVVARTTQAGVVTDGPGLMLELAAPPQTGSWYVNFKTSTIKRGGSTVWDATTGARGLFHKKTLTFDLVLAPIELRSTTTTQVITPANVVGSLVDSHASDMFLLSMVTPTGDRLFNASIISYGETPILKLVHAFSVATPSLAANGDYYLALDISTGGVVTVNGYNRPGTGGTNGWFAATGIDLTLDTLKVRIISFGIAV